MDMHDKVGFVAESCTFNGGKRSVINGVFTPGATAPMHFHKLFDETFEMLEGELTIWKDKERTIISKGRR